MSISVRDCHLPVQATKLFIVLVVLLSSYIRSYTPAYGNNNYSFKHYNINNGLSQNTVHCILQDKTGFMWFGTKDGLNRFDGTSFKVFKFSPEGALKNNVFHHMLEDKNGNIWVATEGGIYIYNPRSEKFERFNAQTRNNESLEGWISDFVQDQEGDIWVSIEEKGVFQYNIEREQLTFYPISTLPRGMKMISLGIGVNNDIWVFPYGLSPIRIDKRTGQTQELLLNDEPNLFHDLGEIRNVIADKNNQLILPTSHKGLVSINLSNKTHKALLSSDSEGQPIFARTVKRIDNQTLWIGTESGIYIYNALEGTVVNLRHDSSISTSLSDNAIYSIYQDRDGGIWVGSYFGGIDYYSEELNNFEMFYPVPHVNNMEGSRVREFYPAQDGKLWIGTEDKGLHLFDTDNDTFLPLPAELDSLYTNIHALLVDGEFFWISTYSKGLNRFHLKSGELKTYVHSEDPYSLSQSSVFALCKDKHGMLWIGTLSGLDIYDYETDTFTRNDKLNTGSVHAIFEDSGGDIWVATFTNGLFRFQPNKNEWSNFRNNPEDSKSLAYNTVTSVFEDSQNRLWITTQGGGFSQFNKEDETFITYNTTNGLPNNVVYQLQEDEEGYLWVSTNSGLARYNPTTGTFRNYTVNNGLKTNQFNYKSSYKSTDGTLYFGSINGFVRFNPSTFNEPKTAMPIVLTELVINNIPVTPGDEKPLLNQSILFTQDLTLPHHKNSFRLSYAVLNYSNGSEYELLYKLDGFDKEWIQSESSNDIIYSNLKPGKYLLSLKLSSGSMSTEEETLKTLTIYVRPPFWQSGWAYVIYFALLIAGSFGLLRFLNYRSQRIQKERMRTFEQQKERELYRSKIDFFTNVAHEIRTPLSLIKAPLDHVVTTEEVSERVKENLQIMSKNTDRLLSLTNQLLDFQKTESDAYLLNLEPRNVSKLIRETFLRFTPLANQRGLLFEMDISETDILVQVDQEAFLKIISNLINNAILYCDTFVKVKAYVDENDFFHLLTDNDGEPIPDKYKQEIFKPFVHLDKERDRTINGTGIGLALSRSLAELHKGKLELENNGDTIRFHLALPVGSIKEISFTPLSSEPTKEEKEVLVDKGTHPTILLVEDDQELLQFEKDIMSPHYQVLTAHDGEEGLEVLRESSVNLVVCDIMMPKMDGFEFTRRVKSDIEFSHIPVILLTAKVNVESKVQGFETGADAYIDKPFSLEILLAQIANLLQNREKLRETFLKHPYIGASSMALTKSDEEFIQKLHTVVIENLDNSAFVVEDIAEQFNMSRASFYRKIKGVLNLTPNEYIRAERLKKAAQLFKEKTYKVNEICYMVGFNSPSYFSKCFQQQFGVLPKDFE